MQSLQSQLAAALLGHCTITNSTTNNVDDDENNFHEEETEDPEEFDEETESENGKPPHKYLVFGREPSNRTVTLQMLLSAGILDPGPGSMTIEYLGQKFVGDLLEDGKIRSQETDIVFASPSAWAIACKRFINPDKKSGCGWASVKYRGRKLDAYKNVWYKKKKDEEKIEKENISFNLENLMQKSIMNNMMYQRVVVKHNTVANRTLTHDANTMIECIPFSNMGKIQPFLVSLHTNSALLMDLHCHLTKSEVSGYLAGHWDINSHTLEVTRAFPCRNTKSDRSNASQVESEISKAIDREKLTLVGWYHSHPFAAAAPTLRDVDAQLDYQIKMKGTSDNSYTPCIGIIISPYNYESSSLESGIIAYWVIPPPEAKPNEYGRPMLMSYSVIQDPTLSPDVKDEIIKCVGYYKKESDYINFSDRYLGNTTYIEKLKSTLMSKFPRDESELTIWRYIRASLDCLGEETETLLSIPSVSKASTLMPNLGPAVSLGSNMMLPTDISSLLFNSGKFPAASSLLGLPDPMAHSTLAANNMFLSTNLFKMQELLKPLSTSSPIPSKSKPDIKSHISSPLKIPSDIKSTKSSEFNMDLQNLKSKMEFLPPDFNISKISNKDYSLDYLANLSKSSKQDFSVPNLSISKSSVSDYSRYVSDTDSEKPAKVPKMDYFNSMLDLSFTKSHVEVPTPETPTDLSVTENISNNPDADAPDNDVPLNLAG